MVKRPILLVLLLCVATLVFAQQSWEGLATVSRFGRFPAGLYGASNLVAPNTLVSVRNLETGVAERIIITDGVSEPGVFIVLSPEAAALLSVSGSGTTRVRLTTIVTARTPIDTASEQPFHPDPDINPAAGVSLDEQLPALEIPVAEEPAAAEEPAEETTEPIAVVEQPVAEPVVEPEEPAVEVFEAETAETLPEPVVEEPVEAAEEPVPEVVTPPQTGRRSGIAAGVARTRVGQAQESFERPDTALEIPRPTADADAAETIEEPSIEAAEVATIGIPPLDASETPIVAVAAEPVLPADEPEAVVVDDAEIDQTVTEPEVVVEVVEPVEVEIAEPETSPIQDAVSAALNRLPARDYFPAPVGESTDLGFSGMRRPTDETFSPSLVEAVAPPVDRPELAGLGPLQALPLSLPESFAEATPPAADVPEYAEYAAPSAPGDGVGIPTLPIAQVGAEERPVVQDLPSHSAPDVALAPTLLAEANVAPAEIPSADGVEMVTAPTGSIEARLAEAAAPGSETPVLTDLDRAAAPATTALEPSLAEAAVAPPDLPSEDGVEMVSPPAETLEAVLAEAGVLDQERPSLSDLDPAGAPGEPALSAVLAEAAPAPEELADTADLERVTAPDAGGVDAPLAVASVEEGERPNLADLGRAAAPEGLPLEAEVAEASVAPPESPDSDTMDMVAAPTESMDAELAEAAVGAEERPVLADVGPVETPIVGEIAARLAEAAPEDAAVADESMGAPEGVPEDALLTLEPADFRPPEVPGADDESLIDREAPAEPPEMVAVLEAPEAAEPVPGEVIVEAPETEPVEEPVAEPTVVEEPAEEPVEVAVAPVTVPSLPTGLPVVTELAPSNYYLQIGAYSAPSMAQVAVDALSATYPMAVLPIDRSGRTVYRVLVGPLEQDETGMLLMWLRAKGYRDTFIRSGAEL